MAKRKTNQTKKETEEAEFVPFPNKLPILPLRDVVIFPNMIYPVLIGRVNSIIAVSKAIENDKLIFVAAQKNPADEDPSLEQIYQSGVVAKVVQVLKLPNNLIKILLEGLMPAKISKRVPNKNYLQAFVEPTEVFFDADDSELQVLVSHLTQSFKNYVAGERMIPADIATAFDAIVDARQKLFYAASNLRTSIENKQKVLEETDIKKQYLLLASIIQSQIELQKIESEIENKVNNSIAKNQKKYFIQEQIRTLQMELGEDEELIPEIGEIKKKIDEIELPEPIREKAKEELEKLKKIPTASPEFSVNRNYLDLLLSLPWSERSKDVFSIEHVKNILDEDHFDLEKPKERILEYIAILNFTGSLRRQILCFVGPPGVGKTSLAKSIARALGRKFVRISLGGVRDEAEIRGHRRTYIGAMPGKIIQSMKKAGTINPVILLDEIDKMATDFRGDPSSALLEVLDPEQNVSFNDHYLEADYDLSNVLFITTANVRYDIPLPLLDRMEIIELNSYLENEKLQIAKLHILPKLLKELGMDGLKIDFRDEAIMKIIREYTRESGVRNLEREIASILRKLAKDLITEFTASHQIGTDNYELISQNKDFVKLYGKKKHIINSIAVEKYLKAPIFKDKKGELKDKVGVANGLAWTSVGGDLMPIEVTIMPSTAEKLTLTGKLGDVMKESAIAALSFIRSNYQQFNIKEDFNQKKEIHIHVPEGAIPKDGPSAGITMTVALLSAISNKALRGDVAMTGEVTLRGDILPIGGLKEKLLAAKRRGIKKVIIPIDNKRDILDFSKDITDGMEIIPISHAKESIKHVFAEKL